MCTIIIVHGCRCKLFLNPSFHSFQVGCSSVAVVAWLRWVLVRGWIRQLRPDEIGKGEGHSFLHLPHHGSGSTVGGSFGSSGVGGDNCSGDISPATGEAIELFTFVDVWEVSYTN